MQRITEHDLKCTVERLNRVMGTPTEPYTKQPDGKYTANVGCYHLSHAYGGVSLHKLKTDGGGVSLHKLKTDGGGVSDVFRCGHVPKRDLYERMHAFLSGIEHAASDKS